MIHLFIINGNFWVAIEGEKVVGTLSLKNLGNNIGMLKGMYVHRDYRNKRIASKLMDILLKFAKIQKYKELVLETYEKLDVAIEFYKKRGFTLKEKDEDRYIFTKELNI
ncbi:MAG TPA: hypothetical protein DEP51_05245 [Clostridiales bacterium]|nr:hypothetical protein [Clostridiales bacterium]